MLAGYPSLNPNDMAEYLTSLTAILLAYAPAVAQIATEEVANKCKFPPSRAELHQACEAAAARQDKIDRYLQFGPSESTSRNDPGPDPEPAADGKHPIGTILANFTDATKRYGRPIGAFEDGRRKPYGADH
jgi:hypothetical protein